MISEAIEYVKNRLVAAGIPTFTDPAAFYPDPIAVLIGVPELADRGLANFVVSVPVHVVSGEALTETTRNEMFDMAYACAEALKVDSFELTGFTSRMNQSDLPGYTLQTFVTLEA